ncbi:MULTISPECIES: methyltransferase domain-containing protein [Polymorphospora]|uniref:methyltransferase domain-containing protein n=1 Tax=Polymorphospora TaxID=338583 RepID=UPI001BB39F38|nr:methyltransferase domain-containing protein [Polymorphospora rubra]
MSETLAPQQDVQDYYRDKARTAAAGSACCADDTDTAFGAVNYAGIGPGEAPDPALLASLGCGNPTAVAELREGETVLDLGSGAGLDLILSARRVGADGQVFGLDFLEEMLAVARRNIADAELDNIVLLKGVIEAIPLPAETVDVVISNCVINLSVDKLAVCQEMSRVLVPGGRIGISDVVAEDRLSADDRAARGSRAECVAGALSVSEYRDVLTRAGLVDPEVVFTHEAADGMHAAIIRARKPATPITSDDSASA